MNKIINEQLLEAIEEEKNDNIALARLIDFGRQQGYVTYEDILVYFPQAEKDVDRIDDAFEALNLANIPFADEAEIIESEKKEKVEEESPDDSDFLANVDIDDTIGLKRVLIASAIGAWFNVNSAVVSVKQDV